MPLPRRLPLACLYNANGAVYIAAATGSARGCSLRKRGGNRGCSSKKMGRNYSNVFACDDRHQRPGKGQGVLRRAARHARRPAGQGRRPPHFLLHQDRHVLGVEADQWRAGDTRQWRHHRLCGRIRPNKPTPGMRLASPMAPRPAKIRRAFAKVRRANFTSPICAISTATRSARCIGCRRRDRRVG